MDKIEKIRSEIERRIALYSRLSEYNIDPNRIDEDKQLLSFLDSLSEESDTGLEEAAEEYADKHGFGVPYDGSINYYDDVDVKASKEGFLAGAEWQKEQMLKDAVEGEIGYWNQTGLSILLDKSLEKLGYDEDIKVKIIIIKDKEDEE